MVFFSVVMATRNRPALFDAALRSVLAQDFGDCEIIVVNDGSRDEDMADYRAILDAVGTAAVRSFVLPARPAGHGGSYARNFAVAAARGRYLCFLDDDDAWTDTAHLGRAHRVLTAPGPEVDLYLTQQAAFRGEELLAGPIWIEDLPPVLEGLGLRADAEGVYDVTVETLLRSDGFAHLNTLIVRRALFDALGGLDERNGWEHDRDLYFRLIDHAAVMKYAPFVIARHNVPDPAKAASVTTTHSAFERRLSQLRVLDRAILLSRSAALRAYGREQKAYTLKRLAASLAEAGQGAEALFYAREALGAGFTVKWLGYCAWLWLRRALRLKPGVTPGR